MDTMGDRQVEAVFDVLNLECPSRVVLQRIGDKWTTLVFQVLKHGPQRFSVIRSAVQNVTPKVLTQTLRTLERDGLLTRRVYAQVPPRVEYELTTLGQTLLGPLDAVRDWAEQNVSAILDARDAYDDAHDAPQEQ
ncbi:winged helix-turn-helix transcriptional regulator [Arthrobacter sp. TMS2-4]